MLWFDGMVYYGRDWLGTLMGIMWLLAIVPLLAGPAPAMHAQLSARSTPMVQQDLSTSPLERFAAEQGLLQVFWRSRHRAGDPVACIALASLDPAGAPVLCRVNGWLATARLTLFYPAGVSDGAALRRIQIGLMRAHLRAVDGDRDGVPGLLSPEQVAQYHHDVFVEHGLPYNAFGGTPFAGRLWEARLTAVAWCASCDGLQERAQ